MINKFNTYLIPILCFMLSHKICATENSEQVCSAQQTTSPALQSYLIPSSTEKEDAQYIDAFNTLEKMIQTKEPYKPLSQANQVSRDFSQVFENNRVNVVFISYLRNYFFKKLAEIKRDSGDRKDKLLEKTSEDIKLCIKNINENKPLEQWDFRLFEDIIVDIYLEGRSKLNGFRFDFIFLMNKRAKESKVWDSDEFNNMKSKLLEANRSLDSLKEEYSSEYNPTIEHFQNYINRALDFLEVLESKRNREMLELQSQEQIAPSSSASSSSQL